MTPFTNVYPNKKQNSTDLCVKNCKRNWSEMPNNTVCQLSRMCTKTKNKTIRNAQQLSSNINLYKYVLKFKKTQHKAG